MTEENNGKIAGNFEIGIIKWAFGYNTKKECQNDKGVILSLITDKELLFYIDDVASGSSLWDDYDLGDWDSKVENEYVVYEVQRDKRSRSGFLAKQVNLLDEVSSDFLRERFKPELLNKPEIKRIVFIWYPDLYLGNSAEDYLENIGNQNVRKAFNERYKEGVFSDTLACAIANHIRKKETLRWPAINWEYFDYSRESDEDLLKMYHAAKDKGFDVKPLYSLVPQIWVGNRDIIRDVPLVDIKKYYAKNYIRSEHFVFLMEFLDDEGKEWIARKVDSKWLFKSPEYCQYLTEDDIISFIRSLDPTDCNASVRKKAENVFGVIDPWVVRNAAEELAVFAKKANEIWLNLLPVWATDPSKMLVYEEKKDDEEKPVNDEKRESADDQFVDSPDFLEYYTSNKLTRPFSVDQRRAIQSIEGKYLLFAIPGSGKTTVMINRIAFMVYGRKPFIDPKKIMCMTFGKDAKDHLIAEYNNLTAGLTTKATPEKPFFCTIHGLCFHIIKDAMGLQNMPDLIMDSADTESFNRPTNIIKRLTDEYFMEENQKKASVSGSSESNIRYRSPDEKDDLVDRVVAAIGYIVNRCLYDDPEKLAGIQIEDGDEIVKIGPLYEKYQNYLASKNLMDFDRSQELAFEILSSRKDILDSYQKKYRYICVDEAQDVSTIQYKIIKMIVGETGNLFMVGDDDQSIFGFRGADPQEMLNFEKMFPDGKLLIMGTNYRSCPGIVNSANAFIKHNLKREKKPMRAFRKDDALIRELMFPGLRQEMEYIAREVRRFRELPENIGITDDKKKKLAILYRKNISALPVMSALIHNNVPFKLKAGSMNFDNFRRYNHASSELIALLRLSQDMSNMELLKSCYPALGLFLFGVQVTAAADAHRRGMSVFAALRHVLEENDPDSVEKLNDRENVLQSVRTMKPYLALCIIMNRFSYADRVKGTSQWFHVYTLLTMAQYSETIPQLLNEIDNLGNEHGEDEAVILTTMHSSKGQEYEKVIILDAIEDFIPGSMRMGEDYSYDPEEERRIFYVALTRAEKELDILRLESFYGQYYAISPYVDEYFLGSKGEVKRFNSDAMLNDYEQSLNPNRSYYAVREGENPGIYGDKKTASEKGNYKLFSGLPTAEAYLNRCPENLMYRSVMNVLREKEDIPVEVKNSVLGLFGVNRLSDISIARKNIVCQKIRYLFSDQQDAVDYSTCAKEYALMYLPANYYKIWAPLYGLVRRKRLPFVDESGEMIRILELGPGPGTATLSLLDFYSRLADENKKTVHLEYTVVEYERAFIDVLKTMLFSFFGKTFKEREVVSIGNLHCRFDFKNGDAVKYLHSVDESEGYDLIIESNMFNANEHISAGQMDQIALDLSRDLNNFGAVIMIEPTDSRIDVLGDLFYKMEYTPRMQMILNGDYASTDLTNNSLFNETVSHGFRSKAMKQHNYRYAVYQKR